MADSVKGAGLIKCDVPLARIEKIYENIPDEVLKRQQPIQSTSVFIRPRIILEERDCTSASFGMAKIETAEMINDKIAPI